MEWRNVHLRFADLKKGDLCTCILEEDFNWNKTGVVLAVYSQGHFFDAQCKEENMLDKEWHKLCYDDDSTGVNRFLFTGINVKDTQSDVLD